MSIDMLLTLLGLFLLVLGYIIFPALCAIGILFILVGYPLTYLSNKFEV